MGMIVVKTDGFRGKATLDDNMSEKVHMQRERESKGKN